MNNTMSFLGRLCVAIACFWAIASPSAKLDAQTIQKHVPQGIVSDWTSHHVLYPHSGDYMKMAQAQKDSRYVHAWYAGIRSSGGQKAVLTTQESQEN